jgi:deoxyribodipyrimidine photolyase-related protein
MVPHAVGGFQHPDGGLMATKPYASGGADINRMSDYCGGCAYDPKRRVGTRLPLPGGLLGVLARNAERLGGNYRMRQPVAGLARLGDVEAVVAHEAEGVRPPP